MYDIKDDFWIVRKGQMGRSGGILGIDTGVVTGWAYLDAADGQLLEAGKLDLHGVERPYAWMHDQVFTLLRSRKPSKIVMEQDFTSGNAFMTSTGHIRGAIKTAIEQLKLDYEEMNPMTARAEIGSGGLKDPELRKLVCDWFKLPERVQLGGKGPWRVIPADIIDAAAVAYARFSKDKAAKAVLGGA